MANEILFIWLGISMLYMVSALYFQLLYREIIPRVVPASLLSFGAGLFISTNGVGGTEVTITTGMMDITVATLMGLAWFSVIIFIREYVHIRERYESALEEYEMGSGY